MKKTPKDLVSTPAQIAVNALVAVSAVTAIIGGLTTKVVAAENGAPSYSAALQKTINTPTNSFGRNTYNTTQTGSLNQFSQDDSHTEQDNFADGV